MSDEKRRLPLWLDALVRVALGLALLGLFTNFVAQPYVIPSESMEPTLMTGDRGVARVIGVDERGLERGDVAAFGHGATWESERIEEPSLIRNLVRYVGDITGVGPSHQAYTVKRIIGLPGETVSCCDDEGRVLVDGEPLEEPYVAMNHVFDAATGCRTSASGIQSARCFPEVTVPNGSYLVLGDNRSGSSDSVSACRGVDEAGDCSVRFVRADQVTGTVGWRWWPLPPGDALRDADIR